MKQTIANKNLIFYKSFYQGLPIRKQDFAHTNIYLTVTSTKDEHYTNVQLKKVIYSKKK